MLVSATKMVKTYLFTSSLVRFRRIEPKKCFILSRIIHVQYTQTESIRLRHCTTRLDSHGVVSRANPPTSGMTNGQQGKRFVSIRSNRLESTTFSTHSQSPDQLYFLSLAQIDFRHDESTEGETIRLDSKEKGSRIDFRSVERKF